MNGDEKREDERGECAEGRRTARYIGDALRSIIMVVAGLWPFMATGTD